MDYIDDVIINPDANFGEDDIFRKLTSDGVTIYPHNKSDNKNEGNVSNVNGYLTHEN